VVSGSKKIRLPRRVVSLGRCVEIQFTDGRVWSTRRRRIDLCSTESGKTLWVLGVGKETEAKIPKSRLYERFTGYYVSGVKQARVREPNRLYSFGRVQAIVYASDKWGGKKMVEYIHHFRSHPTAYSDSALSPSFVKISGGKIRVSNAGIMG